MELKWKFRNELDPEGGPFYASFKMSKNSRAATILRDPDMGTPIKKKPHAYAVGQEVYDTLTKQRFTITYRDYNLMTGSPCYTGLYTKSGLKVVRILEEYILP